MITITTRKKTPLAIELIEQKAHFEYNPNGDLFTVYDKSKLKKVKTAHEETEVIVDLFLFNRQLEQFYKSTGKNKGQFSESINVTRQRLHAIFSCKFSLKKETYNDITNRYESYIKDNKG